MRDRSVICRDPQEAERDAPVRGQLLARLEAAIAGSDDRAETGTAETWRSIRWEMERLHLGRFAGPAGEVFQRTGTTPRQAALLKPLSVVEPPRILDIEPTPAARTA